MEGIEEYSGILCEEGAGVTCEFWVEEKASDASYRDQMFQQFSVMWEDDVMCDVTLLVGPQRASFRAHRLILAAASGYFKNLFSSKLRSSSHDEIRLPFVSEDEIALLLEFVYSGKTYITRENVLKAIILANYFDVESLLDLCCDFIRKCNIKGDAMKLLQFADSFGITKLKNLATIFVAGRLRKMENLYVEFSKLPVDLVLEIIRHPAAVICDWRPADNEEQLFQLALSRLASEDRMSDYIPRLLDAIHLPQVSPAFLKTISAQFGQVPEVKDLIEEAKQEVDPGETQEWHLPRFDSPTLLKITHQDRPIVVDGSETREYSSCVLVKGLPVFLYLTPEGRQVGVECPSQTDPLGLFSSGSHGVVIQAVPNHACFKNSREIRKPSAVHFNGKITRETVEEKSVFYGEGVFEDPGSMSLMDVNFQVFVSVVTKKEIINCWRKKGGKKGAGALAFDKSKL